MGHLDVSDEELTAAAEADLVSHVALIHESSEGEVHREDRSVWFLTGLSEAYANGVLRADLAGPDPTAEIERLTEPFRRRSLPLMWWLFTSIAGPSERVDAALRANGFVRDSDRPCMGRLLAGFAAPPAPAGATIVRVRDREAFLAWAGVVSGAFEDEAFKSGTSVRAGLAMGFGDDAPFRHFACRMEGAWVGAATLSLGARGVAGLANISTLPDRRGRGIGGAVAAAALADAAAINVPVAALSADQAGISVYERLGFRAVGRHLTYVRPATGAARA
jgi:GNAT superfamily N-acetyltransferase